MSGILNIGEGIQKICHKLSTSQDIAKLLTDASKAPLSKEDIDLTLEENSILYKNIIDTPYVDEDGVKEGYIIVISPEGELNTNSDFSDCIVLIDVVLPLDLWRISGKVSRPFLLMSKIIETINHSIITNIGTLEFLNYRLNIITDRIGIYRMEFEVVTNV